jgi:hypothetical protein
MKKMILAAAFVAVATVGTQAQDGALSKRDVLSLFPGNFTGNFDGYELVVSATPDGTLRGKVAGMYYDEGTWRIDGNRLCVAWNTWTGGKTTCHELVKDGQWLKASDPSGDSDLKLRRL